MKRRCIIAIIAMSLAACSATEPVETTCNAANWQDLVGQPEAAVHSVLGNLRIIRDGEPVTADFNPNRLNAEIDAKGHVQRFACY
ncbi:MAG: I78 family peptidase inhibitor [Sulfitobacter sp.]